VRKYHSSREVTRLARKPIPTQYVPQPARRTTTPTTTAVQLQKTNSPRDNRGDRPIATAHTHEPRWPSVNNISPHNATDKRSGYQRERDHDSKRCRDAASTENEARTRDCRTNTPSQPHHGVADHRPSDAARPTARTCPTRDHPTAKRSESAQTRRVNRRKARESSGGLGCDNTAFQLAL